MHNTLCKKKKEKELIKFKILMIRNYHEIFDIMMIKHTVREQV